MSMVEFARWLGIPYNTYIKYEYCERIPRTKYAKIIMERLGLKDGLVFFPNIFIEEEEKEEDQGENIRKRICEQMNSMSKRRKYDLYQVSTIAQAIRAESLLRKAKKLMINTRTEEGQQFINKEVSKIVNKLLKKRSSINVNDVVLYKRAKTFEYEERTRKCTWGIPSARQALGFDPKTGEENVE